MRVLQINKFFYHRGGAEAVFFDTIDGLRARGHEVVEFSTASAHNLSSEYGAYFASEVGELSQEQDLASSFKIARRLFCSREIEKKLRALFLATEPQIVHLHNVYHQLSASTFKVLKKYGCPIVLTVHDVQPMCPNRRMLRGTDGHLCEACFAHRYYNCLRYRCINRAYSFSLVGMLEAYFYYLRGIWQWVDKFLCPSEFMLEKMAQWGFPRAKLFLLRNPLTVPAEAPPLGNKIVYLGRLHMEKGIKLFMAALPFLRQYQTIVAGTGPEMNWVDQFIKQYSLTNVRRIGWIGESEWKNLIREVRVMAVPSLFYENCSMSVLEALSYGRLVVAADRGGNKELVKNGQTGFLVPPENPEELASGIRAAMDLPEVEALKIGAQARQLVASQHNPKEYFIKLEEIYNELTASAK